MGLKDIEFCWRRHRNEYDNLQLIGLESTQASFKKREFPEFLWLMHTISCFKSGTIPSHLFVLVF